MSNKKKIIVMSALVLLLAVTAVFNFVLAGNVTPTSGGDIVANYFTTYREERTSTRNEELLQLDSVIALYDEGDERYEEATKMKLEIVTAMEQELILETMIKSLGFSDVVVTVSYETKNINVFINTEELTYDTALAIYTMLENELGASAENIRIVPVYSES